MPDIVYPLSVVDSIFFPYTYTTTHLLTKSGSEPFNTAPLVAAIQRAAEKWRLIAARINKDELGKYCIKVPTGPLVEPVINFTTATYDISLNCKPVALGAVNVTDRPPKEYFAHPTTPFGVAVHAKEQRPLLSVHVSHLRDATCIGFTLPHGVFDGLARGMIMRAIQDELAGREWSPPPLLERNTFVELCNELPEEQSESIEILKSVCPRASFWNSLRFLGTMLVESYWHRLETKTLYLDEETVKFLVEGVKEQALLIGQRVSAGDVLLAWFIKAALAGESERIHGVSIMSNISFRELLTEKIPSLKQYPHNAIVNSPMPLLPMSKFSSISLAELAILHRSHLNSVRTLGFVGAYIKYLGPISDRPPIGLCRSFGVSSWMVSNKTTVNTSSMDFGAGAESIGFWEMSPNNPLEIDHLLYINKFKGGYTMMCRMRGYRWKSVVEAAEKLRNGDFS